MVFVWHDYCFASEDLTGMAMGDNTGSFIRLAQLLARICHLHDGQLRDTQLSCNAVY